LSKTDFILGEIGSLREIHRLAVFNFPASYNPDVAGIGLEVVILTQVILFE
jgi:hypothetical protein